MITGTYVVYSDGKKLAEYPNMITTNGLEMINKFLTGQNRYWADSMVIGSLASSATTASTSSLQYEAFRYPVNLKTYQSSGSVNTIILKATIDPTSQFRAHEIGVVPVMVDPDFYYDNFPITSFSEVTAGSSMWRVGGVPVVSSSTSPSPRVGALQIPLAVTTSTATNTASIGTFSLDASRFAENNFVHLLYYCTASISSSSITVRFGDSSLSQLIWSGSTVISSVASGAFYVASVDMGSKPTGFNDSVVTASVTFNGSSGSVKLDHMKFVLNDNLAAEDKLISRTSSSTTPLITKLSGQPMEIEYYIRVT